MSRLDKLTLGLALLALAVAVGSCVQAEAVHRAADVETIRALDRCLDREAAEEMMR